MLSSSARLAPVIGNDVVGTVWVGVGGVIAPVEVVVVGAGFGFGAGAGGSGTGGFGFRVGIPGLKGGTPAAATPPAADPANAKTSSSAAIRRRTMRAEL